jgi:hypothetical protein
MSTKAKKAASKKSTARKASTSQKVVVTGKGKKVECTSRTQARRYIKGLWNSAVKDGKVKGKRASCMMKVPENFRVQFRINGQPAGVAASA